MNTIKHAHTIADGDGVRLACNACGRSVSSRFVPFATETPDGGLIVGAFIQCPDCIKRDRAIVRAALETLIESARILVDRL